MNNTNASLSKTFEFNWTKGLSYLTLIRKATKVIMEGSVLNLEVKNYIMGTFPAKTKTSSLLLENITGIKINNKVNIFDIIFAIVLLFVGFSNPIALLFSAIFLWTAFTKRVVISSNLGADTEILTNSKKSAVEFVDVILNTGVINIATQQAIEVNLNQVKKQKPFYTKWWVWVIAVIIIIISISNSGKGNTSQKTATQGSNTKPQTTVAPNKSNGDKPSTNKSTEATTNVSDKKSPYNIYDLLQKNKNMPYALPEKAKDFLKSNPSIFPTKSKEAVLNFVDSNIEYKHLNKSIDNYGDKLVSIEQAYVLTIKEEALDSETKFTTLQVSDENDDSYIVAYIGSLSDIFEKDTISVYGLPIGMTSFSNVSGGTTPAAVLAGCYVKKSN